MSYTKFGEFMRIPRVKNHEVMGDTAKLLDVKLPFVSTVESGKRNVPEERKKQWSQNYKNAYVNMSAEDKHLKYKKVSDSLKKFYANNSNDEIIRLMREHNKASNIATAKIWRTEFFQLFKRTPESFRSCGKMKDAIQLYKRLKNTSKEQQEYEISRFISR